ncbi:metalloproteinase [Diaporthe helianthi]|uniref:Neutral protease 2 n=1 Tax=Diaporthe helianthi TaxID=158607 RepID=A0A2P5I9T3_DIAHE|nr:metalloproteinase [Diaporthe helianthi]
MKFIASLPYLAALANALAVDISKRDSPINVELEMVGNSEVKAKITNTGNEALNVFKTGSILDSRVRENVAFTGLKIFVDSTLVDVEEFQTLGAGETVEAQWDVAEMHDLSAGGDFDIATTGSLKYAAANSTEIIGEASIESAPITATVDGAEASSVHDSSPLRRTVIASTCSTSQRSTLTSALSGCVQYAQGAAAAASSAPASKLEEYFKSSTSSTRSTVAQVFNNVASQCSSGTSGNTQIRCTDSAGACQGSGVAYTVPSQSWMHYCPTWFSFPASTSTCHGTDRPYVVVHEATHLTQVKGTDDYSCYGYTCVRGLTSARNLNHADTYSLFAQAIRVNC